MIRLLDNLAAIVGPGNVLKGAAEIEPYLVDWRERYHGAAQCVVRPGSPQEVAAVVAACAAAGIGIVPQGGNTGLVGGGIPKEGQVLLSLARLDRVRQVDADNNTMVVEAGCTLQKAQQAAEAVNRLFSLSLASEAQATVGGAVSTNAGGLQVLRYGNTRDLVLGLEVVLPDGRVWNGLRALRKDNSGYDLKQLFIGAEGTLGLVTAAVVKLYSRPQTQATAWIAVPSPAAAVSVLSLLREQCGERIVACELIGRKALDLVFEHIPSAREPLPAKHPWQLLVEMNDASRAVPLNDMLGDALRVARERGLALDAVHTVDEIEAQALWALREGVPSAQKREGFSIKHDISLPLSAIPAFIEQCDAALEKAFPSLRIVCFGHVGDGNLHYNLSQENPEENSRLLAISAQATRIVHDLVHQYGGSVAAEHGVGQLKRDELSRYKSKVEIELMRTLKKALDPRGVMNPGKVLPD